MAEKTYYTKRKELVDAWYQKIKSIFEDINLQYGNLKDLIVQLEVSKDVSEKLVNEINEQRESLKSNIESLKTSLTNGDDFIENRYIPFVEKFEEYISQYETILSQLTLSKNQAEGDAKSLRDILLKAEDNEDSIQEKTDKIEQFYNGDFTNLRSKIEDSESGLNALYAKSKSFRNSISEAKKEVDALYQKIKEDHDEVSSFKEKSKKNHDLISDYKAESEKAKGDIAEYLKFAQDGSLSNSLSKRASRISVGAWVWLVLFVLGCIFIFIGLFLYFQSFNGETFGWVEGVRILFGLPVAFIVYIFYENYRYERSMEEQYRFKSISSAILSSHIKTAKESIAQVDSTFENKLADFSLDVMSKIFTEPKIEKNSFKNRFSFGNDLAKLELHVEETVEKVGEKLINKLAESIDTGKLNKSK